MTERRVKYNLQPALQWQTTYKIVKALYSSRFQINDVTIAKCSFQLPAV